MSQWSILGESTFQMDKLLQTKPTSLTLEFWIMDLFFYPPRLVALARLRRRGFAAKPADITHHYDSLLAAYSQYVVGLFTDETNSLFRMSIIL